MKIGTFFAISPHRTRSMRTDTINIFHSKPLKDNINLYEENIKFFNFRANAEAGHPQDALAPPSCLLMLKNGNSYLFSG
jgi:hypothetical protein